MARGAVSLVRTGVLLGAALGLAAGTFLLLDLLGLSGTDRFLAYLLLTTAIAAGIVLYVAYVVLEHARRPLERTGVPDEDGPWGEAGDDSGSGETEETRS